MRKPLLAACVIGAFASPAALAAGRSGALPSSAAAPDAGALAEATSDPLNVNPYPGTPDASPQSQITFPALAQADLASVDVLGSRSGPHAGHLITLPDSAGVAFVPARPFTPGSACR